MIVCHKSLKQLGMIPEWKSKYIHSYHKDKTMNDIIFFLISNYIWDYIQKFL